MSFPLGSALPIGAIVKAPYNLTDPNYLRCDGSIIARASYPNLSALLPSVGTFTQTVRTLSGIPNTPANLIPPGMSANGNNVVLASATGTTAIQYSTSNGATWSAATTPSSWACGPIVNTGTNFVAYSSGAAAPLYAAVGVPGTWTAATGLTSAVTSAASNGAGTCVAISGSSAYISTNNGATHTATTTVAFSSSSSSFVVWTGTQFVIVDSLTGVVQASTTGASGTWSVIAQGPWGATGVTSAASDGAGNIVVCNGGYVTPIGGTAIFVSNNSGSTWRTATVGGIPTVVVYANGRWAVQIAVSVGASPQGYSSVSAISADTYSWVTVPTFQPSTLYPGFAAMVYSGSNYCVASHAGAVTLTENTANMYLPQPDGLAGDPLQVTYNAYGVSSGVYQNWIKFQ